MARAMREVFRSLPQLFITEGVAPPVGRLLRAGACVWAVYCVLFLIVAGISLDETIVPAQIISGAVAYPAGHPILQYHLQAYNVFNYLAAALWRLAPGPWVLSALRNFLFLFLSVFVPFALVVSLTRQMLWGHLAAIFALSETIVPFGGVYPQFVFPYFYSHGHIGIHAAALTLILLLSAQRVSGGFLLGLLPSVHLAMVAVTGPWSVWWFVVTRDRRLEPRMRRFLLATAAGLAVSLALAAIVLIFRSRLVVEAPYDIAGDARLCHQQFTSVLDVHSWLFSPRSLAYLVNPLALFLIGGLLWRDARRAPVEGRDAESARVYSLLLLYIGMVWLYVLGAWFYQRTIGHLPPMIDLTRPFRFSNLTALLIVPLTVTAIGRTVDSMTERERSLALTLLIGLILYQALRFYVVTNLLFLAWGALFAMRACMSLRNPRLLWANVLAFGILVASTRAVPIGRVASPRMVVVFVATCLALFVGTRMSSALSLDWHRWNRRLRGALLGACALAALASLLGKWNPRHDEPGKQVARWDTISEYDRALSAWLAVNTRPDEMILPAVYPRSELQAKTGHPVVLELVTLWLMGYLPSLCPSIATMVRELYGVDYTNASQIERICRDGHLSMAASAWTDAWPRRELEEWQALGRKWRFRLVLSPSSVSLKLPVALPGPLWTLYTIPGSPSP